MRDNEVRQGEYALERLSIESIKYFPPLQVGDDAKMRCVCAGDDSDDDVFGNAAANQPEQVYDTDDDVVEIEQQQVVEVEVVQVSEQALPYDTPEMIGSTKSLIPLSPTAGSNEQHFTEDQDEKASKCDVPEKPLVIL